MFINPKFAIQEGWVRGIMDPHKQLQPNAIDFDIASLHEIDSNTDFILSEQGKQMRRLSEVTPRSALHSIPGSADNFWLLHSHTSYDFSSNMYVELPEGVAAMLIIRSTLNRNGLFLTSGLYDSGFKGHVAGVIHNNSGDAYIAPNTRIGQIMFIKSDSASLYLGGYNHSEGTHHGDVK